MLNAMRWPNECNIVVQTEEQHKCWMMLKTMFDGNQTSFNNIQHHATTMLDDVASTCGVRLARPLRRLMASCGASNWNYCSNRKVISSTPAKEH